MTTFPIFAGQFTLRQRHQLPDSPGIYFVVDERERLLYIGQAKSLRGRWAGASHHRYKQFYRKGLDKIALRYILTSVSELEKLEREYIEQLKPLLNESKVKKSLPKTSPRFGELQRLLKLTSTPLFPSVILYNRDGQTIPREAWDLFRGFVAGVYFEESLPYITVVCQQNMGELLLKSLFHRTKKRFYIRETEQKHVDLFFFDARQAILVFADLFDCSLTDRVFKEVYPNLVDCQLAGVILKRLSNPAVLMSALQEVTVNNTVRDYLLKVGGKLQPFPADFTLNKQIIW